jgi:MFS family permease
LVFSLGLLAFSFAGTVLMAMLLLATTGFALLLLTAGANTLMQTIVAEDKRGRVLSLYTMAVTGLAPMGGLLAGLLADNLGAPLTLRLAGLACLAGSVSFALRTASANSVNDHSPSSDSLTDQREKDLVFATCAWRPCRRAG